MSRPRTCNRLEIVLFLRLFAISSIFALYAGFLCESPLAFGSGLNPISSSIVYGDDDRMDPFELAPNSPYWNFKKTTAVLVTKDQLTWTPSTRLFQLPPKPLATTEGLCYDQQFFLQPSPGKCTGFLINPNTLATAGHCLNDHTTCENLAVVFNFAISDYRDNPTLIAPGNVFRCKEVLLQKTQIRTNVDFALIRLDRAVTNIPTIKLRTSGKISDDASLSLLGHPSGLPLKIVDNGTVKENHDDTYFKASIDAFAGNSGSPIFNNDTLQIEGMLIRGESDYEILGDCKRVRTCQHNECSGEIITRIQEIGKYSFLSNAFKDKFEAPISRPLPIPDMKEDGVSSQIKVNHRGRVKYLGVSYEVNHDNSFDLKISLTHPDGSEIVLDNSIRQETYHISKKYGVGGKYLPALENWAGKQSHGTWTLRFTDRYNRDIGHVLSASLTIIYE